jgi:signal transduction histidine kinase/CheY-like chemotaxis protein
MEAELLTVLIADEEGVFTVRRRARDVATAIGFDGQDQVRVATALGEVGREALAWWGGAKVTFLLRDSPTAELVVQMEPVATGAVPQLIPDRDSTGIAAAARLLDRVEVRAAAGDAYATVVLAKRLPANLPPLRPGEIDAVRSGLVAYAPATPLDELHSQNGELLATLDALTAQQQALVEVNAELEETNRGVMAMYTELSGELEETNRGVVALYAELDDKGLQIQEASDAKSRFLASVSHELRSPVNSILGLTRLLTEPDGDGLTDEQTHQVRLIASTTRTLLDLVNDLLDLAKAESGRIEPEISDVDLRAVFHSLRATMAPLIETSALVLDIDDPAPGLELRSDEQLLVHILRNLLTNAIKFTEHGTVTMQAARAASPTHLEFTVSDTGIGIETEHQARVFEEFYQVPNPLQSRSKGTGLGLPYVRRIAELLGGDIALASTVGEGTTVTVRLPVERSTLLSPTFTPPEGIPAIAPASVGTVLLVDDDATFRHAVRDMLEGRATEVIEAADGEEALEHLRAGSCDLVFLDLHMPNRDGRDVLAHLREDPTLGAPMVVVVTSLDPATLRPPLADPAITVMTKSDLTVAALDALLAAHGDRGEH